MPRFSSLTLYVAVCVAAPLLAPLCAQASEERTAQGPAQDVLSVIKFDANEIDTPTALPDTVAPSAELSAPAITPPGIVAVDAPALPVLVPQPFVETPLHRLFCVEYARMRSGLAVFGDARTWWDRAKNLYTRVSHPVEEAVMVFSGSRRVKRGHVAVVTNIVGPRRIIVDQANWQNHGEIDHATPVLDVSAANDWSQVRVWDIRSGGFGSHVYAISGFIAKELTRQASRN